MEQLKEYISKIEFDCKWGRYDAKQVDDFISNLQQRLEGLQKEMETLKEENARYAGQSASMAAAMIRAEETSNSLLEQAKAEAEEIRENAKREGEEFVKSMYDRQSDMESEYRTQKEQLISEVATLKSFKEQYQKAIEKDVVELLGKITKLNSDEALRTLPEELRSDAAMGEAYEGLDLNEIIKDLPETDHELKAMIEGLL